MTNRDERGRCPISSDAARRARADETGGAPRLDFPPGETPYVSYARMGDLLRLQHPRTSAPTEPAFIVMSQVKELMFSLLVTEVSGAAAALRDDRLDDAIWTLRRTIKVQQALIASWDVFSAMSPIEFAQFRDVLGDASGFQSVSYRRLEFALGNKNPAMVAPHRNSPSYEEVRAQLLAPSLYDEVLAYLRRRGLPIPPGVVERDPSEPYQPHAAVEDAWRDVYADPTRHRGLYLLAEALMDVAELFARWRYTHLVVVQRVLGGKPGTGGTHGVPWLEGISGHRFFPELWSVRSAL